MKTFLRERLDHHFASSNWPNLGVEELTAQTLRQLFVNEVPFVRLRNFATQDECEQLIQEATRYGFSSYRGVEPKINKIGITVFEYNHLSREQYFADEVAATERLDDIFARSFDPISRLMRDIESGTIFRARAAQHRDGRPYYVGLIRRIERGTLTHIDFAPAEQKEWEVANVTHQLSWNLYLRNSAPEEGRTHIYERQWKPGDDQYRDDTYGYDAAVVGGSRKASFLPAQGELVIFNTRNYHYVEPTSGERVTVTSAMGELPGGEIAFWS